MKKLYSLLLLLILFFNCQINKTFETLPVTFSENPIFREADSDNGIVLDTHIVEILGLKESVALSFNFNVNDTNHIVVEGVPSGLSLQVQKQNSTALKLFFIGRASNHSVSNDQNIKITLKPPAFSAVGNYAVKKSSFFVNIKFREQNIIRASLSASTVDYSTGFSSQVLRESSSNNGSIQDTLKVILFGTNDTIKSNFSASDLNVSNLPNGLSLRASKIGQKSFKLWLLGSASAHSVENSINNLQVSINSSAFDSSIIVQNTSFLVVINFIDLDRVTVSYILSDSTFKEDREGNATIKNTITVTTNFELSPFFNVADFTVTSDSFSVINNKVDSLEVSIERINAYSFSISLLGTAANHTRENDFLLTITPKSGVFKELITIPSIVLKVDFADKLRRWSPRRHFGLVAFKDKLWLIGGRDYEEFFSDVWSSEDGIYWDSVIDFPTNRIFPSVTAIEDTLFVGMGAEVTPGERGIDNKTQNRERGPVELWKTTDPAVEWFQVLDTIRDLVGIDAIEDLTDNTPYSTGGGHTHSEYHGYMSQSAYLGNGTLLFFSPLYTRAMIYSLDYGNSFYPLPNPPNFAPDFSAHVSTIATLNSKAFAYATDVFNLSKSYLHRFDVSSDMFDNGSNIISVPVVVSVRLSLPFSIKVLDAAFLAHDNALWLIGGAEEGAASTIFYDDVWTSRDEGENWEVLATVNSLEPSGSTIAVSFKGSIFYMGGVNENSILQNWVWNLREINGKYVWERLPSVEY